MNQWIAAAKLIDPALAGKIIQDGAIDLVLRLADGVFDAVTKVALKKTNRDESTVIRALREERDEELEKEVIVLTLKTAEKVLLRGLR